MHQVAAERPQFAPPPQRGTIRALILALLAHALLIAALTWGVRWKRDSEDAAVEAELWSSTVQQTAPRITQPPTPPAPRPTPAPPPPPPETTPAPRAPDIALEREKKRKEQQVQRELEQAREQEKKKQLEAKKREEEERKKAEQQKQADQKKKEAEAAAQADKDRQKRLRDLQALAGAGNENATGTAARSSGPSAGYAARIAAAVRPNINYPDADASSANPKAEFVVDLAPDGTIVNVKLSKSSGVPAWDEAAERGLRKTDKLPRDVDGRIITPLLVVLNPKR